MISDGDLAKSAERATFEAKRQQEFDESELAILNTAVSNAEFHYLGCGKILACIGKEFAEAMRELMPNDP